MTLKDNNVHKSIPTASGSNSDSSSLIWISLGGLALGVGGYLLAQGVVKLYRTQRSREDEWVRALGGSDGEDLATSSASESDCIYLDYNGTTPVYEDVLEVMLPYLKQHFGNPSAAHAYGKEPRRVIDQARLQVLRLLNAEASSTSSSTSSSAPPPPSLDSIWFTGSGTESDNLAIQLALQSCQHILAKKDKHVVTCNVEHPAIELYLKHLEQIGQITMTVVPVQSDGRVLAKDVIAALQPNTILVTIMVANNETGAIQPIAEISTECRKRGILMHTDAAQAVGKISVGLSDLGYPDMISIVGHKIGAPKGIGALYVRPGCLEEHSRKVPHSHGILLIGGGQEFGRRGGTENTPYIVGFGYAAQKARYLLEQNAKHMEIMRTRLLNNLQKELGEDNVRANGPQDPKLRLPNTLSVGLKGTNSAALLASIGHLVAATAGATCHGSGAVSAILQAMNVPMEFARGTLRLTVGPKTTAEEIDRASKIIAEAAKAQWEKANKEETAIAIVTTNT